MNVHGLSHFPARRRHAGAISHKSIRRYHGTAQTQLSRDTRLSPDLAYAVAFAKAWTAAMGAVVAFWSWLGFIGAVMIVTVGFQGKPITLWLIDPGYDLVGMIIGGIILAVWKPKRAPAPVA